MAEEMKQLTEEELEEVNGGYDFHLFDSTYTEDSKVSDVTADYSWLLNLYPELKYSGTLTIKQACSFKKISYAQLDAALQDFESKYNSDGTPKTQATQG